MTSALSLIQLRDTAGTHRVAVVVSGGNAKPIVGALTTYELAFVAIEARKSIAELVAARELEEEVSIQELAENGNLLPPITHPDPAHLLVSGTGLTHLGSADARDRMHAEQPEYVTDSMRMFEAGVRGGRAAAGEVGVVPEWFFKGTGASLVGSDQPLVIPDFALDGGEEPEVAGVYVIGPDRIPYRIGFALANEFSDHVQERQNYLLLAHSKLRTCAIGPELRIGALPASVQGTCRIVRDDKVIWEKTFLTGEENMSHTLSNLEHHHFKYGIFRQPGDVHVHTFGTATLSFADGVRCEPGDVVEISADAFSMPLRNRLLQGESSGWIGVRSL